MTILDSVKIVWHILGLVATVFIDRGALKFRPSLVAEILVFYLVANLILALTTEIYLSIHPNR